MNFRRAAERLAKAPQLTPADERALHLLVTFKDLVRPGHFGALLWPETRRKPQTLARPAGRVLRRLERAGLARWDHRNDTWGWEATPLGRSRAGAP